MDIFATFLRHINVLDEDFSQPRSWHRIRGGAIYETYIFKGGLHLTSKWRWNLRDLTAYPIPQSTPIQSHKFTHRIIGISFNFRSWNLITWPRMDKIMAIKVVGCRFLNLLFILLDFWANFGQHDQILANIVPNWPKNNLNKNLSIHRQKPRFQATKISSNVCLCACMWRACVRRHRRLICICIFRLWKYFAMFILLYCR